MNTPAIIDMDAFFEKIIEEYTQFGDMATLLALEISTLHPQTILHRCRQLNDERQRLSALDNQLIEIIDLAREELSSSNHISRYRVAFSTATLAIEEIQIQLRSIRQSLQETTLH